MAKLHAIGISAVFAADTELDVRASLTALCDGHFHQLADAGLINVIVKTVPIFWGRSLSDVPTIGASGAIFGILLACAILFPDRQVYLFPIPIKITMRTLVIIMTALEFLGTFGVGGDDISHICHLGGMLIGYIYLRRGSFLYNVRNSVSDWKMERNKKRFQVYMNKHKEEPPSRPDRWVN